MTDKTFATNSATNAVVVLSANCTSSWDDAVPPGQKSMWRQIVAGIFKKIKWGGLAKFFEWYSACDFVFGPCDF